MKAAAVAIPRALVVAVVEGAPPTKVPLAPPLLLVGAWKITFTPARGLLFVSKTLTANGIAKVWLIIAL